MFDFHSDKSRYFQYQYLTSRNYVIPFLKETGQVDLDKPCRVLEIGSAEAGVLKAFTETGHQCLGIELSESRVETARGYFTEELASGQIDFLSRNIYDIDPKKDLDAPFDIIILKDVIEHIHDQQRFIEVLGDFMAPGGVVFFGFPPWYMPFGGHQQVANSRFLRTLPYFHLFPVPIYRMILKAFGENQVKIDNLLEIKETGISVERFERICKRSGFQIAKRRFYLTNPIYQWKFKLKVMRQIGLISAIPFVRNFLSTAAYYVIKKA